MQDLNEIETVASPAAIVCCVAKCVRARDRDSHRSVCVELTCCAARGGGSCAGGGALVGVERVDGRRAAAVASDLCAAAAFARMRAAIASARSASVPLCSHAASVGSIVSEQDTSEWTSIQRLNTVIYFLQLVACNQL